MTTDYKKDFIKCLKSVEYSRHDWDIFADFLDMASLSIANVFLKNPDYEKEYLQTVGRYKKGSADRFPELLEILTLALEQNPWQDFLGTVYQEISANNKHLGQFFTPFHVSEMMAQCSLYPDDIGKIINEQGYFTMSEPCSGAGGMIIACAKAVQEYGFNPQQAMYFDAVDLDKKCFAMTYIQTSLLGLAGCVHWGNSISLKMFREYSTPMLHSDVWQFRFITQRLRGVFKELPKEMATAAPFEVKKSDVITKPKQLALF